MAGQWKWRGIALALLVACAPACSGNQTSGARAPRTDRNIITQEQLRQGNFANAYEAVEALRSNWLRPRGVDSFSTPGEVQVYRDGVRVGSVGNLRSMPMNDIAYVQYYDGITAAGRWGLDHGHGVIFVSTRER